jgi:hypothetical protein
LLEIVIVENCESIGGGDPPAEDDDDEVDILDDKLLIRGLAITALLVLFGRDPKSKLSHDP